MHQYRYDPTSDRWVIIAEGRSRRPEEFLKRPTQRVSGSCPFCAGNEDQTPRTLEAFPPVATGAGESEHGAEDGWLVRVVPNKYPAACLGEAAHPSSSDSATSPAQLSTCNDSAAAQASRNGWSAARGVHEVIIESPQHASSFADVDSEVAGLTFLAYRNRMQAAQSVPGIRYAQVFKNEGPDAGASLEHTHSQLLATPFVPRDILAEREQCARWFQEQGGCVFCRLLLEARQDGRVIAERDGLVAFCPFASRFPFEVWVVPESHASRFDLADDATVQAAGKLSQTVIGKIRAAVDRPPYNLWIHSDPFDTYGSHHYHWHIEIAPRYNPTAGYEFGGGAFINPVAPETAAKQLRNAVVECSSSDQVR